MRKTTFKPKVTTVLQITAGQTLEAVVVDDKVFIEYPMPEGVTLGGTGKTTAEPADALAPVEKTLEAAREKKVVEDTAKKVAAPVTKKSEQFTEDELMDMDVKELTKICKERKIEIPEEGKNTNKKLRLLILEAQDGAEEEAVEEEEDTPAPTKRGSKKVEEPEDEEEAEEEEEGSDDERATLIDIFTRYDAVEIDDKKCVKELIAFGYEKDDAQGILDDFNEDTEVEIEAFVDSLLSDEDEEEDEDEPAPAKKSSKKEEAPAKGKKTAKEKKVEIEDLEVGDKVKVYFESEEEYYTGEVKSIDKKGNVTVDYDDNTTDVLDEEENTEIFVLS
jgi:hypothetical protein